uniref:Uncharacterized protein n=1 Tax=viral metagenome TaxID=1070528 RepID=A0A6C0B3B4_9ZZZZ
MAEIFLNDVAFDKNNLIIKWKGKTFNQITSRIQMNTRGKSSTFKKAEYFRALPILLPRREIATNFNSNSVCDARMSLSINVFDQPGGSIINSSVKTNNNGLVNTMDNLIPNNICEDIGTCLAFVSPSETAKRRVRSAGMIKRQFDISKGNDKTYFVDKAQYLVSRNLTFQQNQYNYIRSGNAKAEPGDALSSQNLYSAQGLSHCKKYYIPTDCSFSYQWVFPNSTDNTKADGYSVQGGNNIYFYNQVDVSAGYYTVDDVNNVLHLTMLKNGHYLINKATQSKVFTIYFAYNPIYNKMELHSSKIDALVFSTINYTKPFSPGWDPTIYPPAFNYQNLVAWPIPSGETLSGNSALKDSVVPVVVIYNNAFTNAIGFSPGIYPTNPISTYVDRLNAAYSLKQNLTNVDNYALSNYGPGIQPVYKSVVYKPSNPQFASQGGVSASSATQRVRYNTITNNTAVYQKAYGTSVANALAYGVPENGYTIKDKLGYPSRSTPRFAPLSTVMQCATCNTWDPQNSTKMN